jgi:peptide/nickel transport system substrate-binding protein
MTTSLSSRRRGILVATFTATTLLAAVACSGGSSSPSTSSAGGTRLALAILGAPPSFDLTQLDIGQSAYIWGSLYDTLLYTDNKGQIQPNAAETFKYSDDLKTLTLTLRKGMTFSSAAPVNAASVKASLERIRTTAGPNQAGLGSVESVEAPDDLTVVLKLKRPDAALLPNLAVADGAIGDPATMTQPNTATDPVGSGPYTLDKSSTVAGSAYTLKKRADYWNASAYPFQTVRIRVMTDRAATTNALQAGELNAGSVDWTQVPAMKSKGLTITPVKASTVASLVLADRAGTVLKPLADVRVRKAINMAFDRKKLTDTFLRGSGVPATQLFNPLGQAYDAALDKTYPYDVAGAKKLLADAGYPQGFSVTMPSFSNTSFLDPTIAQSLADIGIKVKWTTVPPQQSTAAITSKKYPMFFIVYGLDPDAVATTSYFGPDSSTNPFHSTDPGLTKLIDDADGATDPAKAGEAYKKINNFAVTNAWFAPIFQIGINWVTAKGVTYLGDGSSTRISIRAFGVSG